MNCIKYLGVFIDDLLNWKYHIDYVCKKVSPVIGVLYRIRDLIPKTVLTKIYYSMIQSCFQYCIESWGSAYVTNLKPLLLLQKKAVRIITFSSWNEHTENLFKSLNILPLIKLYQLNICIMVFKEIIGYGNINVKFGFVKYENQYNTRYSTNYNLNLYRYNTNFGRKSLLYQGAKLFNSLPLEVKNIKSLYSFKKAVKLCL
jgi:hypothetical protein